MGNARRKPDRRIEWVGTIVTLQAFITGDDDGGPYRPEATLWVDVATGLVVGTDLGRPGDALASAREVLRAAIARGTHGAAGAPSHVRVDVPELAAALDGATPNLVITCAPVPELSPVIASLTAHLARASADGKGPETYLGPGIGPKRVAGFFRATAELYRAAPWSVVPGDACLEVTCEALGVVRGVMTVVGQLGQTFGFGIFPTLADYDDFLAMSDAVADGERGPRQPIPRHLRLDYSSKKEIGPDLAREIARERWTVAGPGAYPQAVFVDGDGGARPLTDRELAAMGEVAAALADMIERSRTVIARAWDGGQSITHRRRSDEANPIEVVLVAPSPELPTSQPSRFRDAAGDLDEVRFEAYVEDVIVRFLRSPEGAGRDGKWAEIVVECAAGSLDATIEELGPAALIEILFAVFPHRVDAVGSDAAAIVDDTRALVAFAVREHASDASREGLAILDLALAARLARVLDDPSQHGPAKALVIAGRQAGFDMTTEAGVAAYMRTVNNRRSRAPTKTKSTRRR